MSHASETILSIIRTEPFHHVEKLAHLERLRDSVRWCLDEMGLPKLTDAQIVPNYGGETFSPVGICRFRPDDCPSDVLQAKGLYGHARERRIGGSIIENLAWGLTRERGEWVLVTMRSPDLSAPEHDVPRVRPSIHVEAVDVATLISSTGLDPLTIWRTIYQALCDWDDRRQRMARDSAKLRTRLSFVLEAVDAQDEAFQRSSTELHRLLARIESLARSAGYAHASQEEVTTLLPRLEVELAALVARGCSPHEFETIRARLVENTVAWGNRTYSWHGVDRLITVALAKLEAAATVAV